MKKKNLFKVILITISLFVLISIIDFFLIWIFNFNPLLGNKIKSSKNFITYSTSFYRVFECNDKKHIDFLYQKSNYCEYKLLEEKDINSFSSEIVTSFNKYKNKFIVLSGKVSHKEGNNYIELKSFNNDENDINGNVIFNDNIIYKIKFNSLKNIKNLKLYDNVKIVGRIDKIQKNEDIYTIVIKDSYIPEIKLYNDYKINIVEDKKCQKDKTNYIETKTNKYYTSCLSNIYVVFDDEEVYELSYVLKDEKIKLEDLLKDYNEIKEKEEDKVINKLYVFEDYKILLCGNNNNIIIGNEKLDLENNYCNLSDVDNNEL